jgi:hypothetical protein
MSRKLNVLILLLNLGLVGALAYAWFQNRQQTVTAEPEESAAVASDPIIVTNLEREIVTNQFHWAQIEAEDYRSYIARLRSIGCPEQTIVDIIIADLDKVLAPKISMASGHRKNLQYWQPEEEELANDWDPREVARKMQEIDREKRDVIHELVGVDLVRERLKQRGIEDYYERRLGFLPDEKQTQVRRVLEKYEQQEQALLAKEYEEGDALTPQDKALLRSLRAQRQSEVQSLLSPEEQRQYELWMSPTANAVRHNLYGMDATERDFQTIYAVRKQFDEQWSQHDLDSMDPLTRQRWEEAKAQMDAKLKEQLGEKFHEYKRGEDEDYHQLCSTLTRLKLPRQKANEVYEMKQALLAARQEALNNRTFTAEQRQQLLQTLHDETTRAARQVLGDKAFNFYTRSGSADWLRN